MKAATGSLLPQRAGRELTGFSDGGKILVGGQETLHHGLSGSTLAPMMEGCGGSPSLEVLKERPNRGISRFKQGWTRCP